MFKCSVVILQCSAVWIVVGHLPRKLQAFWSELRKNGVKM